MSVQDLQCFLAMLVIRLYGCLSTTVVQTEIAQQKFGRGIQATLRVKCDKCSDTLT